MIMRPEAYYTQDQLVNLTLIGNGGQGTIYKWNSEDHGVTAVKMFFPNKAQDVQKYRKEIEILLGHTHPNIVTIYGIIGDKSNYLGYIMEYVKDGSLSDVIYNDEKTYDTPQICLWIKQICLGLKFLHKNGIIHRDIKPANILVAGDQLKLADFGTARQIDNTATICVGTLRYMAPEVIISSSYSCSADIYSVGITIWEIFHRKIPYSEHGENEFIVLLQSIREGTRPTNFVMHTFTANFVQQCWQEDASKRPVPKEIMEYFGHLHELLCSQQSAITEPSVLLTVGLTEAVTENNNILILGCGMWRKNASLFIPGEYRCTTLAGELPVCCGAAVYLNDELYIIGTIDPLEKPTFGDELKRLYKLEENLQWSRLKNMNFGRCGIKNSILAWNGYIWVFGGRPATIFSPDPYKIVERYDPTSNMWYEMREMNHARTEAAATIWNNKIIICGGRDAKGIVLKSIECYDPVSDVWTELSELPYPVYGHCMVSYQDRLILIGGDNGRIRIETVMEMRPYGPEWILLESMKSALFCASAIVFGDEIFVFGDCNMVYNGEKWKEGPTAVESCTRSCPVLIPRSLAGSLPRIKRNDQSKCCVS